MQRAQQLNPSLSSQWSLGRSSLYETSFASISFDSPHSKNKVKLMQMKFHTKLHVRFHWVERLGFISSMKNHKQIAIWHIQWETFTHGLCLKNPKILMYLPNLLDMPVVMFLVLEKKLLYCSSSELTKAIQSSYHQYSSNNNNQKNPVTTSFDKYRHDFFKCCHV